MESVVECLASLPLGSTLKNQKKKKIWLNQLCLLCDTFLPVVRDSNHGIIGTKIMSTAVGDCFTICS